jgi:hypothetical protein
MVLDRTRPEKENDIIYHYCSANTLVSIIKNSTIRYSAVDLLNDGEEERWGRKVFQEAAEEKLGHGLHENVANPNVGASEIRALGHVWSDQKGRGRNFAACFSEDGDSLSQWRAYADDGRGFAVGFYTSALRKNGVRVLDVLYDHREQINEMSVSLSLYYGRAKSGQSSFSLENEAAEFAAEATAFKNPAWRDEKEVRCIYRVGSYGQKQHWQISPVEVNGPNEGSKVIPIEFASRSSRIVPYFDMPFQVSSLNGERPIAEIVFGPKCLDSDETINYLLGNFGYGFINKRRAGVAYR